MDILSYDEILGVSNWRVGHKAVIAGQRFECIGFEPYERADGVETALVQLASECPTCGVTFVRGYPALVRIANLNVTRRCPRHARSGRISKRVKRKAALARKNAAPVDIFG